MHRKPTTKSHIIEKEEEQCRAKKKKKPKLKNGAPTRNNETMDFVASAIAAAAAANVKYKLMSSAKILISRSTCIANPNHKHIKPKLPIWAELEPIRWFQSSVLLEPIFSFPIWAELEPIWWLLVMVMTGVVVAAYGRVIKGQ